MEKISEMTYGVVCLVVIVILIGTICIPVIEDVQSEQVTKGQNSTQLYTAVSSNSNVEITLSDGVLTVNDYDVSDLIGTTNILCVCNTFAVLAFEAITGSILVYDSDGANFTTSASIVSGVLTYTPTDATEKTVNVEGNLIYAAENGTYGNFTGGPIYFNESSQLYIVQTSRLDNPTLGSILDYGLFSGTYEELTFHEWYVSSEGDWTVTIELPEITEGRGCLSFDSVDFIPTVKSTNGVAEYQRVIGLPLIAPIEYTYLTENSNMIYQLLNILPLLLLIIPVMGAVALITRRD